MSQLTIPRNYADGAVLTKAMLDAAFDSVETKANTTKWDADNLADLGVTSGKLDTNIQVAGTLGATGACTLSSTLSITGAVTMASTLAVTGAVACASTLAALGLTSSATLHVVGAATLDSTLAVTGNTTLTGTLGVTGNTTHTGTVTINAGAAITNTSSVYYMNQPFGQTSSKASINDYSTKTLAMGPAATRYPIVVSQNTGTHGLRIVRGGCNSSGTITKGGGFTVSAGGSGQYTLTYTDAFGDTPSIAISAQSDGVYFSVSASSTSACTIHANPNSDTAFDVIVIGVRSA